MMARVTRLADNKDIQRMWSGDIGATRDFFAIKHHSKGYKDKATLREMNKHLPLPEGTDQPVAKAPESESNLLSGLLSSQDQAMEPTPAGPIEPQPSLAGTNFGIEDRRRQGMMAGLGVDMPTTERVTVPQPSLGGTNFGLEDARERTRQRQMDSLQEVTPTQRGQVPIPQRPPVEPERVVVS